MAHETALSLLVLHGAENEPPGDADDVVSPGKAVLVVEGLLGRGGYGFKENLEQQQTGFYVDVGAHHPKRFSNTNYFYKRGWRGINIDPNPDLEMLFRKYRPRDINLICGVSDLQGELTYYMFNEPALNTFNKELADTRASQNHYEMVATKEIKVERLETVLLDNLPEGTRIDFMCVDAEGHDFNVVCSNNWDKFRPKCLIVEALASTVEDVLRSEIHKYIAGHGYELFAKTFIQFFILTRALTHVASLTI